MDVEYWCVVVAEEVLAEDRVERLRDRVLGVLELLSDCDPSTTGISNPSLVSGTPNGNCGTHTSSATRPASSPSRPCSPSRARRSSRAGQCRSCEKERSANFTSSRRGDCANEPVFEVANRLEHLRLREDLRHFSFLSRRQGGWLTGNEIRTLDKSLTEIVLRRMPRRAC